ncbi:hypothetical protein NPIL_1381 [Nephila pilipes]|uniref:C2H2-type domain-containing protein n=1 Tax=Nephila pilipes TaxID=299642 RepID=A0A8X6TYJ2_NEPPI|nr:hypothetical protein NPIL_1381 [Nephila pilipes]
MSGMFECVNHTSVAESDFVICGDNSNPDSAISDVVPCSNDFSVAESDFFMYGDNSNPNSVTSDIVYSTNDKSVGESEFVCPDCFQSFKYKYNLKRHVYKLHNNNTTLIESFKSQCANDGNVAEEPTDGKCIVSYQKVHVGHQNNLGHLFLTADERKNIASKIAAKIPPDNILDEIRNSISEAGLERVHLLTKKRST